MSGTHSLLSPSKAARWTRCVGSLAACKGVKDEPSIYAAEGTAYHELSEWALLDDRHECELYVGQTFNADGFAFTIDAENADHAQTYVDAIRRIPGLLRVEVKLDCSEILGVPDQGGTGDAIVLDFESLTIHVNDLKFGRGETVYAKDNEQMVLYGAAALRKFSLLAPWRHVKVAIHQPRIDHYDEHTYAAAEIAALADTYRQPAIIAYELYAGIPGANIRKHLTPGEKQCRWCPIRGSCAARTESILKQFTVTPAATAEMTEAQLGDARTRVEEIEAWCKDIKTEAQQRAAAGKQIPGWKLVVGRKGARRWIQEQLAAVERWLVDVLKDAAYAPREIVSPAAAEKLLKKQPPDVREMLGTLITQSDGAPQLVRDIDMRPALAVGAVEFGIAPEQPA